MQGILNLINVEIINSFKILPVDFIVIFFLIFAAITDIKYLKVFNKMNYLFLISRVITGFIYGVPDTAIMGGFLLMIVLIIPAVIQNTKSMAGDIKLLGNIGLFLGYMSSVVFLGVALVYSILVRLVYKGERFPFAPFFLLSYLTMFGYYFLYLK